MAMIEMSDWDPSLMISLRVEIGHEPTSSKDVFYLRLARSKLSKT